MPGAQSLPTCQYEAAAMRTAEVTTASWTNGVNRGAANAPGIGINTGSYDPKASDWSRHARNPQDSQHIGRAAVALLVERPDEAFTDNASFVQATQDTADGAALIAGVINRTGDTVPNGSWCWGTS